MKRDAKRGEILTENLIFILLNLTFVIILVLFIFRQGDGAISVEESYAKQIALILDSAKPGMEIEIDLSRGAEIDEEWFGKNFGNSLVIEENLVKVKFREDGGYSYSFFNDLDVDSEVGPSAKAFIIVRGENNG